VGSQLVHVDVPAVLGAYFVLFPTSRVLGLIGIFPVRISAWFFLGFWFRHQLYEAGFGLFDASANGGGVAFIAHVGGFVFGFVVASVLRNAGRLSLRSDDPRGLGVPA
jgi:rhomboid family protein